MKTQLSGGDNQQIIYQFKLSHRFSLTFLCLHCQVIYVYFDGING